VTRRVPLSTRPRLVIDTNVLLLLIGYKCSLLDNSGGPQRVRLLEDIRGRNRGLSPDRFDDMWQLFSVAQSIVTSHVIAEAYNLGKNRGYFRGKGELVWSAAQAIVDNPGIEEVSFAVSQVKESRQYQEILKHVGPTDTGVLHTAERRKASILTEDRDLQGWAAKLNIPWRAFEDWTL